VPRGPPFGSKVVPRGPPFETRVVPRGPPFDPKLVNLPLFYWGWFKF